MTPFQFNPDKTHEVYCPKCKISSIVKLNIRKCEKCDTYLITVIKSMLTEKPLTGAKND